MIPLIKQSTLESILGEMGRDPKDWVYRALKELNTEQDVLTQYLVTVNEMYGEHVCLVGVVVYKLIKTQMEVNALET